MSVRNLLVIGGSAFGFLGMLGIIWACASTELKKGASSPSSPSDTTSSSSECKSDKDCKGDRVCEKGPVSICGSHVVAALAEQGNTHVTSKSARGRR